MAEPRNTDKLSSLMDRLKELEHGQVNKDGAELTRARAAVMMALRDYRDTRFNVGRVLHAYKTYFKAEHGWTAVVQAVAGAMNKDERTVYRIIADYERASHAPTIFLEAMEAKKLDPAAPKNAPLIQKIIEVPAPSTHKEATAVVERIQNDISAQKREKRIARKSSANSLEEFAAGMIRHFEKRFGDMPPNQRDAEVRYVLGRIVNTLRADIKALRQFKRPTLVPKPGSREAA